MSPSIRCATSSIDTPPPPGVKAYVTGAAPLVTDQFEVGRHGTLKTTLITLGVIAMMLFSLYRRLTTVFLVIFTVMIELTASRGVVAVLANAGIIELSTYSTNLLTLLVIAAGTDYAIFILGRFHEARYDGQDRVSAFNTMYHGTAHIILGSGLTIAGAVLCLTFTRLPYFNSLGIPAGIGVLVAVVAALTLAPALLVIGRHFGLFEPSRPMRTQGWRRIGTAIVRWPVPILLVTVAIAAIGLLSLSGYKTSYDARPFMPASAPANVGYAAAERHFSEARLNPELLMIEADHDLRNSTDMILLERVAKAVFHTDGIAQVQSITRPLGTPLDHTSIPFQISAGSASQINNLPFQQARGADLLKQVDVINNSIDVLRQQYALQQQSGAATDEQTKAFQQTVAMAQDLRDKIANFDDFFRPLRNYFYWEPHCFDIPACAALRSLFDALDGIDALTDQLANVSGSIAKLDELQPKLLALIPPQIASQQTNRDLTLTNYATTSGINDQTAAALQNSTTLGQAYDAMRDTVGLVMMEQGKNIDYFTDADFQAAIDDDPAGQGLRPDPAFTGNEYTEGLAKGDIAACVAWTGDVVQLQFDDPNIQYALPEKGFTLWSDNFVIPALATHKKNAEKLIDYYYDPAVMAQVAAWVNYIAPVKGTKEELVKIDPDLGDNPLIVPTPEVLSRAQVFRGLTTEEETKYNKLFSALTPRWRAEGKGDLSLVALTKSFATFTAVHPLDLTIPQGSFFALLGPSGCGKTTTLRMIAGLEEPTAGRIRIGDSDITQTKAYQRNVNTVFQSYALFPHMSVLDNVMFGLRRRGDKDAKAKANEVLELVQLGQVASKKPTQLSGGMQQRVALARALVNRPDVLLLDEPLGALDLKLRRQMQIELKRIQQEVGLTFIHVTHDQEEAMTMADSIAVMNAGSHRAAR